MTDFSSTIINKSKSLNHELITWRRALHRIPETGLDLFKTSQYVKARLTEMGISYRISAETGIFALIEGGLPNNLGTIIWGHIKNY